MKILGAILICVSTAMIGVKVSQSERTRCRTLEGISFSLDFMIAEISCLLTPIREVLEKLALQAPEPICRFFSQCALRLETSDHQPITQIWFSCIEDSDFLCLNEQDLQLFREIGSTFGRYSVDEQVSLLKGFKTQIETLQKSASEAHAKNGRVYRTLGITCGIALVILLI